MIIRHISPKQLAVIAAFIFICSGVNAQDAPVLEAEAWASIMWGTTYEYVYDGAGFMHLVSKLDWQENNVFLANGRLNLTWWGFFVGADVAAAFRGVSGTMEDRDWMNTTLPDKLTHISWHELNLNEHIEVSGQLGYSVGFEFVKFSVGLGYHYLKRDFMAYNGSYNYTAAPSLSLGMLPTGSWVGPDIQYIQMIHFPFIGLGVGFYSLFDFMDICLSGRYYPYIVADCVDYHFRRVPVQIFNDVLLGGMGGKVELSVYFHVPQLKHLSFFVSGAYEAFETDQGFTYVNGSGNPDSTSRGKSSGNYVVVSLGVKYSTAR